MHITVFSMSANEPANEQANQIDNNTPPQNNVPLNFTTRLHISIGVVPRVIGIIANNVANGVVTGQMAAGPAAQPAPHFEANNATAANNNNGPQNQLLSVRARLFRGTVDFC